MDDVHSSRRLILRQARSVYKLFQNGIMRETDLDGPCSGNKPFSVRLDLATGWVENDIIF